MAKKTNKKLWAISLLAAGALGGFQQVAVASCDYYTPPADDTPPPPPLYTPPEEPVLADGDPNWIEPYDPVWQPVAVPPNEGSSTANGRTVTYIHHDVLGSPIAASK